MKTPFKDKQGNELYVGDTVKSSYLIYQESEYVIKFGESRTEGCSDCAGDDFYGFYLEGVIEIPLTQYVAERTIKQYEKRNI